MLAMAVLLAAGVQCTVTVVENDSAASPYHTAHFALYFDEIDVGPGEIEMIGLRKEELLRHVNAYWEMDFNGVMEVVISDTVRQPHATLIGRTYESPEYARNDDGHEIAHVVVAQQWGAGPTGFIREGMAVSAERRDKGENALIVYARRLARQPTASVQLEVRDLAKDILANDFVYTFEEYARAGAFLHYLKERFGVACIELWYAELRKDRSGDADSTLFENAFGRSVHTVLSDFGTVLETGGP